MIVRKESNTRPALCVVAVNEVLVGYPYWLAERIPPHGRSAGKLIFAFNVDWNPQTHTASHNTEVLVDKSPRRTVHGWQGEGCFGSEERQVAFSQFSSFRSSTGRRFRLCWRTILCCLLLCCSSKQNCPVSLNFLEKISNINTSYACSI